MLPIFGVYNSIPHTSWASFSYKMCVYFESCIVSQYRFMCQHQVNIVHPASRFAWYRETHTVLAALHQQWCFFFFSCLGKGLYQLHFCIGNKFAMKMFINNNYCPIRWRWVLLIKSNSAVLSSLVPCSSSTSQSSHGHKYRLISDVLKQRWNDECWIHISVQTSDWWNDECCIHISVQTSDWGSRYPLSNLLIRCYGVLWAFICRKLFLLVEEV